MQAQNDKDKETIETPKETHSSQRRKTVSLSDGAALQWNVETTDGKHTITVKTTESQLWDGCISMRGIYFDEKQVYPAKGWCCAPVISDGSFPFEHDGVHFEVQANDVHPELCCSQRNTFDLFVDGEEIESGIYKEKYLKSTSYRSLLCSFCCCICFSLAILITSLLAVYVADLYGIIIVIGVPCFFCGIFYLFAGFVGLIKGACCKKPLDKINSHRLI